ncbi:UDP-N-acetylmuramoyl-tripeptide--D-alanyl-D-alanine ligase [Patescibacteria group bacterium]|nr:UDP-N-acetylmuramoyl-tripeptide--D-alanyl-D-alanine ligase [Patescibacteria group bacterium]
MSIITAATASAGLVLLIISTLSQVALWQRKEYRWDRLLAPLNQPRTWLPTSGLVVLATLLTLALVTWRVFDLPANALLAALPITSLTLFGVHHGLRLIKRGLLRPSATARASLTTVAALSISFALAYLLRQADNPLTLTIVISLALVPIVVAGAGQAIGVLANLNKQQLIAQATTKRRSLSQLTVVGITGSYGKSSVKNFLRQIMEQAGLPVVATADHRNSNLAVAQDLQRQLTAKTRYYIVEMGAYRPGEIKNIAQLVSPTVGVITAIGNQHLALFGSLPAIAKSKWELIEALPKDGVAVLNADDEIIVRRSQQLPQRVIWYSTKNVADVYADQITSSDFEISADFHIGDTHGRITLPLLGQGMLEAALAAAATAQALQVNPNKVRSALAKLQGMPRTMERLSGRAGSTIIDDSYSANEQGALTAIAHLATIKSSSKKVVVLEPLIELGDAAPAVHRRLGQALKATKANIFLTKRSHSAELLAGLGPAQAGSLEIIPDVKQLASRLKALADTNTVILLEGRIPTLVRAAVIKEVE